MSYDQSKGDWNMRTLTMDTHMSHAQSKYINELCPIKGGWNMGNLTIDTLMSYDKTKGGLNMRTLTMDTLMSYNKSKVRAELSFK